MNPATWPRDRAAAGRLLHVDPKAGRFADRRVVDLPRFLRPGDLLVLNDAATLPASLAATAHGRPLEVRLLGAGETPFDWTAVLFGEGSWRQRTEDRPAPPELPQGDVIDLGEHLRAEVVRVSAISPRLVDLRLQAVGADLWTALLRTGRPVQYSYLAGPLALWHVQTAFGARPWAVEMPSAGRPLSIDLLQIVRGRGVEVARLTHATGLSSTGDPRIDERLPFPERYDIPAATVEAVSAARARGGRVVAAGTTVVRALEGAAAANRGTLRAGAGVTDLRLSGDHRPSVVDGLFTGIHEPGSSHFDLAGAFAPPPLLEAAFRHAEGEGYLGHEFGDSSLILAA